MRNRRLNIGIVIISICISLPWSDDNEIPLPYYDSNPFQLDYFQMGDTKLGLSTDDTLNADDLSRIIVEGYDIENAVVVSEPDPNFPLIPSALFRNLADDPNVTVIDFNPKIQTVILESPITYQWKPDLILSDTSFGGWLKKIRTATKIGHSINGIRWKIDAVKTTLVECIRQGDISFIAKPNLTITPNDSQWVVKNTNYGMAINISQTSIKINPVIHGRIKIQDGEVITNTFQISGNYDIFANIIINIPSKAKFNVTEQLPIRISHNVPLGAGLFINLSHSASITLDLESFNDNFITNAVINSSDNIRASFTYARGTWYPLASIGDNGQVLPRHINILNVPRISSGVGRISIQPHLELAWCNDNGLLITHSSYYQLFQMANFLKSVNITATTGSLVRAQSISSPDNHPVHFPPTLLNAIEKSSFTPPIAAPVISVEAVDEQSITLKWDPIVNSSKYHVQLKFNEAFLSIDSIIQAQYTLSGLQPQAVYIFRIIPANSFGYGVPGTVICTTTAPNLPPSGPNYITPLTGSIVSPEKVFLSWNATDPNITDKLFYTVYLDTNNPPISLVTKNQTDSFFVVPNLIPGLQYFWKVDVSDGKLLNHGPIVSFSSLKKRGHAIQLPKHIVKIPGGSFIRSDGNKITVSTFFMDKFEISQTRFQSVMNSNPSHFKGAHYPVENVNWYEARKFCQEQDGRLPTEAEWEYASRGNQTTDYSWGQQNPGNFAWFWNNSQQKTQPIGLKKANFFGLHDMHGNVFEWIQDWHGPYTGKSVIDPQGPGSGKSKVTRGGSWYSDEKNLKTFLRFKNRPNFTSYKLGFRCVYNISETTAALPK